MSGDAVDVVARLKEESDVPLRSHGSLSLNRALMAAGPGRPRAGHAVPGHHRPDRAATRSSQGAADFDLELVEHRTLDGHTQELIYRPALHQVTR